MDAIVIEASPSDVDQRRLAFALLAASLKVVEQATGEILKPAEGKNPHAQALSALGASKGSKARAESLSKRQRTAIAKKAAAARWKKSIR